MKSSVQSSNVRWVLFVDMVRVSVVQMIRARVGALVVLTVGWGGCGDSGSHGRAVMMPEVLTAVGALLVSR